MNRREFSTSLLAGTSGLSLTGQVIGPVWASADPSLKLSVVSRVIDIDGRAASVFGLTGSNGRPGLSLTAGETAHVVLANTLGEGTLVHWHGLTPAWSHDGVPDMPMPLLKPGEERGYDLPGGKPGTHWMHAHTLQEQNLLAAPLIVRSKEDLPRDEQEVVVLLHDFSFTPAGEILAVLKSGTGMGRMKNMGAMAQGDVNDIEYDAYLANDRTLNDPEVVRVEKGGRVRLRLINGATATAFTIDTGLLDGEVIAADGQDIVPIKSRTFPLSMGQRVDFRLALPKEGGTFPIFALREGARQRTGIILATPGAPVGKIASAGDIDGPILSLATEAALAASAPLEKKAASRVHTVDLIGGMQDYSWGMRSDGDLSVSPGERVVIEMRNMTMMAHPMHLHGHHFQIVAINGNEVAGAVRDTIFVPYMNRVAFAFDAINSGEAWAFHCHHLYHMASGMMTTIGYGRS